MEDTDEKIFDAHFCPPESSSMNTADMASTLQGQKSVDLKNSGKVLNLKSYLLRRNSNRNVNKTRLINANSNLEEVCKLVCKPVSVSVTKLSISDLKGASKETSQKTKTKQKPTQMKKDIKLSVNKTKKSVTKKEGKVKQYQTPVRRGSRKNVQYQFVTHKKQMSNDCKEYIKDFTKNVNQPCIKLRRIDEVINKIALTFAKVIPNKDSKANILPQHIENTTVELNASISQPLPLSTTRYECSQNNETERLMVDSHVNEKLQAHEDVQNSSNQYSCSNESHVDNQKKKFKRTINATHDSERDDDETSVNDKSQEIIPREAKRLKLDSTKEAMQISVTDKEPDTCNNLEESVIKTTHNTEKSLSQMGLTEEVNGPNELCELSKEQHSGDANEHTNVVKQRSDTSENESQKLDCAIERIEEDCTSNCVPSETDFIHTSKSNVRSQLEDNSSATVEEPMPESNEIQEVIHKPFISKEDLVEYKLLKDLRVFLIKLDCIKTSSANKYSATEIEQLTDKYVDSLLNSNFLHIPYELLSNNSIPLGKSVDRSTKPDKSVESLNICENEGSNTCAPIKNMQNINEESSSILDKSLHSSEKEQIQQKKSFRKQHVTKNVTEFVENNSMKETSKEVVCENSAQKSMSTSAVIVSPLKKSTIDGPDSFSGMQNTENTQKLKDISHSNSTIKSTGEVLNSTFKEKVSTELSHNENSEQAVTDAVPSGNIETTKCKKFVSTILTLKNDLKGKSVSNNKEKALTSGKKMLATKLHSQPAHHKVDGKKNTVASTSISPMKHNTYKCIVCNLCFDGYSALQQHLTTHTQKQSSASLNMFTHTSPSKKIPVAEKQQDTASSSLESKTTKSLKSDNIQQTLSKSPNNKKNKESHQKTLKKKAEEAKSSPLSKKKNSFSKKRLKFSKAFNDINECGICLRVFPTDVDLAAHIYLHTESELQRAYQVAKMKEMKEVNVQVGGKKSEQTITKESVTEKTNNTADNTTDVVEKSLTVNSGEQTDFSKQLMEQNQNESTLPHSETRIPQEETMTDPCIRNKSSVSNESESGKTLVPSVQNNMEKEKINKVASSKKGFTICQCHNRSESSDDCLQIEIVLLCHTCRVLFRSMECFETHYRLPDFTLCNQNRLESGRSPNLFCAVCGMIFSSVQDVRHHLQMHARFKQSCTMDFRCNICKVVFIGIGSLFYIHWSKHAKDPFWMASEQSFPKTSVIKSKLKQVDTPGTLGLNNSIEQYIQVAEHICCNCKLPFVTEDDLKKHELKCKMTNSVKNKTVEKIVTSDATVEKTMASDAAVQKTVTSDTTVPKTVTSDATVPKTVTSDATVQKTVTSNATVPKTVTSDATIPRTVTSDATVQKTVTSNATVPKTVTSDATVPKTVTSNATVPKTVTSDATVQKTVTSVATVEKTVTPNATVQKQPTIHLICSVCNVTFPERIEFYKHLRSEHNFACDLQFVCVPLRTIKRAFICTICMEISDGIDEFEEHWLKHYTKRLHFTCTCCEKSYSSINSLLDHIKGHESVMREGMLYCKVNYQQAEFICEPCTIGFESHKGLTDHNVIHKLSYQMKQKNDKESDQESSTSTSQANDGSSSSVSKELIIGKEKETSVQQQVNVNNQMTEKKTGESPTKSKRDFDREMLIRILEENEDDSENELMIDLTEPAEERYELQTGDKNKEKQTVSTSKLNETNAPIKNGTVHTPLQNVTTSTVSNGVTQASKSVTVPAPSENTLTSTPQNLSSNLKTSVNDGHVSCVSSSDSGNSQSIVSANKEEPPVSSKSSPTKPKQGYLRVRSLAELVGNKNPPELVKAYGCTFEKACEIPVKKLPSQQPSNSASEKNKPMVKFTVSERPSQQMIRQALITPKRNLLSSTQSSTSAYHKNLPACNIIRTNVAIPRSSLQRSGKVPVKIGAKLSNVQNIQAARTPCSTNENPKAPPVGSVTYSNTTASLNSSSDTTTAVNSNKRYNCGTYPEHLGGNIAGHSMPTVSNMYFAYKEQNIEHSASEGQNNVGNGAAMAKDNLTSNNQNYEQSMQATPNVSGIKHASPNVFYQYPTLPPSNLSDNNQTPMQSQQMILNHSLASSAPPSFYYKNSSTGGMSIVINQTTPTVQTIPTIGILPQLVDKGPQSQMYQPLVLNNPVSSVDSYIQQPQNVTDFSGSRDMYQMATNQYNGSVGETMTYEVMLQPTTQIICPYCPKTVSFISEELLQLHIDSNHIFDCSMCGQRFHTITDLTIHRLKHKIM